MRALFDEALAEGTRLMVPRAVVRWLPVDARGPDTLEAYLRNVRLGLYPRADRVFMETR